MEAVKERLLYVSEDRKQKIARLTGVSHDNYIDLQTVLDWDKGVNKALLPKDPEHLWIAGTPYLDQLTPEQAHEVAWLENARDVSMFIWLELTLPELYMGYVTKYYDNIDEDTKDYLMVFSKEEIIHTMVFRRYMAQANLKLWRAPDTLFDLLTKVLPSLPPHFGVFFTLMVEWVAELSAMHTSQGDAVDPLTREMFKAHHVEEARHIAFGRWISDCFFAEAAPQERGQLLGMAEQIIPSLIDNFTYNADMSDHTSFDFPIQKGDSDKVAEIWNSDSNKKLNQKRFAEMYRWLDSHQIAY